MEELLYTEFLFCVRCLFRDIAQLEKQKENLAAEDLLASISGRDALHTQDIILIEKEIETLWHCCYELSGGCEN